MAWLADKLLAALDQQTVVRIVAEDLQPLGIQRAYIAVFDRHEQDADTHTGTHDKIAYTKLLSATGKSDFAFASRHFPPPALSDHETPWQFMLLPLMIQDEQLGYVIFEAADITYCGELVQHIAAALYKIRLYHEAIESRRVAEEAITSKAAFSPSSVMNCEHPLARSSG
jgi:hypothetical protein